MIRYIRYIGLIPLVLLARPVSPALPRDTVLTGEHFAVHVHFDSPELAKESLELVEALWPTAAELFGVEDNVPEEKLQIHLYRNAEDYLAAEEPLTQGKFARNLAFTHWATGYAHVALQPDRSDELVKELGLDYQTARLLTHEASHVVRIHACNSYRSHPRWFADAAASWIDEQVLARTGWIEDPMDDPYHSSMMLRMQALAQRGELPAFHTVLDGEADDLGWQGTYDLHAQLFAFVRSQGKGDVLGKICREARRLGGGSRFQESLAKLVYDAVKRKPKQLDKEFSKFLAKVEPQWEQIYASLHATGEEWTQLAFSSANAMAWRTADVKGGKLKLVGEARIFPGDVKQLNLLIDRQADSLVQVCLVAGYGVTVFEQFSEGNVWERRADVIVDIALDEFVAFEVQTKPGQLVLKLDGTVVLKVELEREFDGPWGLGVQRGGAGMWRGVGAQ